MPERRRRLCGLAGCALAAAALATVSVLAQSTAAGPAAETFDVISVKPNQSGEGQRGIGFQPGGRFRARNMTVRGIIAAAYGAPQPLPLFRVIGGPSWIDADRYDVDAVAAPEVAGDLTPPWPPRGGALLQALMKERFRLTAHHETRNVPAYDLVVANRDRGLGPQLTPSTGTDCVDPKAAAAPAVAGTPSPIACGGFRFTPPERLSARYLSMDELARFIMLNVVERPVINRTGLAGRFSIELDYTRALTAPSLDPAAADSTAAGTSIFTALPEQLGLKLEPATAPLDIVVIDSIERPTAN